MCLEDLQHKRHIKNLEKTATEIKIKMVTSNFTTCTGAGFRIQIAFGKAPGFSELKRGLLPGFQSLSEFSRAQWQVQESP